MKKLLFIFFISILSYTPFVYSNQTDYYPIIFVHGHGGDERIEDTWTYMSQKINGENEYSVYGKIWRDTVITNNIGKKKIFLFGFYRNSASNSFGTPIGKIGGLPLNEEDVSTVMGSVFTSLIVLSPIYVPIPWYTKTDHNFKSDYFDSNRESYGHRLSIAVDNVLAATGAEKVILISHSMGGLVCRSYIKWFGGHNKVFKILTVGTPNNGILDDHRAAMEQLMNPQDWQDGGEYIEMSVNGAFNGKSYTDYLNEDWQNFCEINNVRYATIAGNLDPWLFFKIGDSSDGVIDVNSVSLEGAEFNALSYTAHIEDFGVAALASSTAGELCQLESTYTEEIIKRWIFRAEVHKNSSLGYTYFGPSPFKDKLVLDYTLENNHGIMGNISCYDMYGNVAKYICFPVYQGHSLPRFNVSDLNEEPFIIKLRFYDMEGQFGNVFEQNVAKTWGNPSFEVREPTIIISFTKTPSKYTSSRFASFDISSNFPGTQFAYKLDTNPISSFQTTNNNLNFNELEDGSHVLYVYGKEGGWLTEAPIYYSWIIGEPYELVFENERITGVQTFRAKDKIITKGTVIIDKDAQIVFSAGKEIILSEGFETETGCKLETEIE